MWIRSTKPRCRGPQTSRFQSLALALAPGCWESADPVFIFWSNRSLNSSATQIVTWWRMMTNGEVVFTAVRQMIKLLSWVLKNWTPRTSWHTMTMVTIRSRTTGCGWIISSGCRRPSRNYNMISVLFLLLLLVSCADCYLQSQQNGDWICLNTLAQRISVFVGFPFYQKIGPLDPSGSLWRGMSLISVGPVLLRLKHPWVASIRPNPPFPEASLASGWLWIILQP